MEIHLFTIGKTKEKYLQKGIDIYLDRLKHYVKLNYAEWSGIKKSSSPKQLLEEEGDYILSKLRNQDYLVLLDEGGKTYTSEGLAQLIETWQIKMRGRIWIVVGGAYGFSKKVKQRADLLLSLSKLTFTHQMVRLFVLEQIYRAFTIIKGEKYHNA